MDLPEELRRVRTIEGIDEAAIGRLVAHGHAAAFTGGAACLR